MNEENILYYLKLYEGELPFYGDYKSYVTWNSIFFEGIDNELNKVKENKQFNPTLLEHYDDLLLASKALFLACNKLKESIVTTRIERLYDFSKIQEKNQTIAFTSTSKNTFLKEYQDKEGIVLLEFHLPKDTYAIDFEQSIPNYKKRNEAEVLLPPYTKVILTPLAMSEEEIKILDKNGNPPACKYRVDIVGIDIQRQKGIPILQEDVQASIQLYNKLNKHIAYSSQEVDHYLQLKKALRSHLRSTFYSIFNEE